MWTDSEIGKTIRKAHEKKFDVAVMRMLKEGRKEGRQYDNVQYIFKKIEYSGDCR